MPALQHDSEVHQLVQAIALWDGAIDAMAPMVHAIEGVGLRARRMHAGDSALHPADAGAWMRLEALLLALIARFDLTDPLARRYAQRIDHAREKIRTHGPLARVKRLA